MPSYNASEAAGSHRVTRCVGKLTFVQKTTKDNMVETTVSVEQLTRDEALDVAGVTRCRDCKHAFDEGSGYLYCGRRPGHCFETRADGFCKWGEPVDAE